jgi:site-specific DNA-methyltransferase (adenine-specific)
MFTFVGETVLDPFLGSGTTSLAARITGRNSVGYEINEDFFPVIRNKIDSLGNDILNDIEYIEKRQHLGDIDWNNEIKKLPYTFNDPVEFDKKKDPKKHKFGSKIEIGDNSTNAAREDYYTVKEILGANLIRLNNDQAIRLIGVNPIIEKETKALSYLNDKVLKKKVYLKFDEIGYDENNNRLAYVYTKNRIFINSYLIKAGFADVDDQYSFKHKRKFEKFTQERVKSNE